jgi:hypothetical protein
LQLLLENSRSPDLVVGRVPLLVESLLIPPRVFGRPAAPLAGFGFLAVAVVTGFFGEVSGRLLGCDAGAVTAGFASGMPVLPLLDRVLG